MVAQKGGKLHTRSGWAYVFGMTGVAITALFIGIWRIFYDPNATPATRGFAAFLIMIAIFSSTAVWSGLRVLKFKGRKDRHLQKIDLGACWVRIITAVLVSIYGFHLGDTLVSWFPLLPILTGIKELKYWYGKPEHKMHWWFHHMTSMFTACIATVTAFAVTAVPRLTGKFEHNILLWTSPAIILVPLLALAVRRYKTKFGVVK
jgi:uncharacterized membrane protein